MTDKVALVTGSSRGIGKAISLKLAKEGFIVIINSTDSPSEGKDVRDEIVTKGGNSHYFQADVSDKEQVISMFSSIAEKYSSLDVLINNAGRVRDATIKNLDLEDWEDILSTNLTGTFLCTKHATNLMEGNGGRIINIASIVGEIGNYGQSNYAASKGGVIAFTKTIAKEMAGKNIVVNAVAPGFTNTRMVRAIPDKVKEKIKKSIPQKRFGKPEEIAQVVSFLASDSPPYLHGQVIHVNGGLYM